MRRAAGLVIIDDNKILMVSRRTGKIGIPGGKAEGDEFDIETALRETYEETGLVCYIPNEDLQFVHNDVDRYRFTAFRGRVVAGRIWTPDDLHAVSEGQPFWLDLGCFKAIPNILQYPEWSRQAIRFFKL